MYTYIHTYIYIYTSHTHTYIYTQKRRLWGLRFGNPLFSVVLYVSKGCAWVSVSVGRSFGAHVCMILFPTTKSALDCFKPGGLFINTGFVYKHFVSVYRAFSVLSLLDLLVVFYVYCMILNSCFLVLLLVVCLFVFIFICCDVAGKRWRGGGQKSWLHVPRVSLPPPPPLTPAAPAPRH